MVGDYFDWRIAYFVGASLGFVLLILRIGVYESGMYDSIKTKNISRGNFFILFKDKNNLKKYLYCIAVGIPIWFIVSILITFSPEFAKYFNITEPIAAGKAVMFCYIGLAIGDFLSGALSQIFKSRKKIIEAFIIFETVTILIYLFLNRYDSFFFYTVCITLGVSGGYWAVFVTNASEQFGINIRATVTTTVPNFVRGAVVPVTLLFEFLKNYTGIVYSALFVAILTIIIALFSVRRLDETYGKDLNYIEVS